MLERNYQARLIRKLELLLPGVQIFKGDTRYKQGSPDLIILYKARWAVLEVKADAYSRVQPNQEYYVALLNDMSYSAIIHPDNEEVILGEVQRALQG